MHPASIEAFPGSNTSDRVCLNVGGYRYETYVATLQRDPESLLGTMFADRNSPMLKAHPVNGEYFFDRNGRTFEVVLDYCRTGKLILPQGLSLESVREELDFFQIGYPSSRASSPDGRDNTDQFAEDEVEMLDSIVLSNEETDFCAFLAEFASHPAQQADFEMIFKKRRLLEEDQRPMNGLLLSTLAQNHGLVAPVLPDASDDRLSRRNSKGLLNVASVLATSDSPLYQRAPLFQSPLSPYMQRFLERTICILADAKSANVTEIKMRIDLDCEIAGIPSKLDRVQSQKRYWADLAQLIHRCVGVSPPNISALMLDVNSYTQKLAQSSTKQAAGRQTHGSLNISAAGNVDAALTEAWEAAQELFQFRCALAARLYGDAALEEPVAASEGEAAATEQPRRPDCFRISAVRKKYPATGKGIPAEYISHWEAVLTVP